MEISTNKTWRNGNSRPGGLIIKLFTVLVFGFAASAQTALAYSTDTPTQNAGWGDHNYFDRHTLDCGLGGMSRVKLHVSAPVGWTASGLWDFHYDCDAAYQDGSTTKYTGWNHDGNGNVIYLDRHAINCGNKPLQFLQLQTTSGDRMRYQYKCGTSSLTNISHHYTSPNDDGQRDRIAWNGIYLDRHNVDCPSGKVLTYMRLQRPSSNTIRYHYKCGRIGANATTQADTTTYPVVFIHGMGGKAANFADSFGSGVENSPWMGAGQKILRVQTSGLNHSEYRGHDVYNQVVSFMTATGATKVNMVGHSQGGLDMRKVAHMLKNTAINGVKAGKSKVGVMLSLQSPHRGSPVADTVWSIGSWADPLISPIFNMLDGNGGDGVQFWDAVHQLTRTSMTHFNNKYPSEGVANYVGSFLTAQEHSGHNDWVGRAGICKLTIDNMFRVLGKGSTPTGKDDCLVSVDREQMGHRLVYNLKNCSGSNCSDPLNTISQTGVPYVSNLNNPGTGGSDLNTGVMNYDHFDMINSSISANDGGFDEHEFYAAIVDFIACKETNASASCDGPGWQQVGGALKQIDVGSEVWGVNGGDYIYARNGSGWTNKPGRLKHVSVSSTGAVWGVNSSDYIYRYNRSSNNWTNISGRLKQIDVGSEVWGVNSGDYIYRWHGNGWTRIPGRLKHVSVGPDGEVWGVNANDYIYRYNRGSNNWTQMPGRLKQIDVGSEVWGVNSNNHLYKWNGSGWNRIPGLFKHVSVGSDGSVWAISPDNKIYKYRR